MVIVSTVAILIAAGCGRRRRHPQRSPADRRSSRRATSPTARPLATPASPGATERLLEGRTDAEGPTPEAWSTPSQETFHQKAHSAKPTVLQIFRGF